MDFNIYILYIIVIIVHIFRIGHIGSLAWILRQLAVYIAQKALKSFHLYKDFTPCGEQVTLR